MSALSDAVRAARPQRDPRHRVSMLVNDWQAIEDAAATDERDTLERMRDAEFLTALRTAWANVKAAWLEDDSTQAFALIEMDLLLGVDEQGHPLDAHARQPAR